MSNCNVSNSNKITYFLINCVYDKVIKSTGIPKKVWINCMKNVVHKSFIITYMHICGVGSNSYPDIPRTALSAAYV